MVSQLWWYWLHRVLWDEGLHRLSAAIAMTERDVDPATYSETLYGGGVVAWVSGVFLQSRVWLERSVELRREIGEPGPLGMAMCALAQPTYDLGQRDEALTLVREGSALARDGCTSWDLAVILTTAFGYVHHASGLWDAAEQAYLEADGLWSDPPDDWGRSLTRNSLAVIAWRRGDLDRAQAWARDALGLLRGAGDRWFASRTLQVLGYMHAERGDVVLGTKLLAASEAMRGEVGARLMAFEVPEWNRAVEHVRSQLGGAAFTAVWREGAALDFEGATEFALSECDDVPEGAGGAQAVTVPLAPQSEQVDAWPPADRNLVVRAFGALEVRREGRVLTNEDWTYAKPRELLFYLLTHPGGCTKEQIGLDLWPDASPARLRSSFHVTVHHLRRALGAPEWVAFHEGRYRFEAARSVVFDVEQFESWIDEAALLRAAGDDAAPRRLALLQAAVDLYRGDFLDDAGFGDWSLEPRDRLRRRFADAAVDLATCYHAQHRHDEAATTCRALLARDNLDERAHRLLMEVLAAAGRPADALRHYNVLVALFREELGIGPSAETLALAQRIGHS
jgi:DNA-binding SARP family transcriptional activator